MCLFLNFDWPLLLFLFFRSHASFFGEDDPHKSCCGVIVTQTVSIRWFIVMIAFVGICCSIVGTVLGAMKASGREHLTVSLLMIGIHCIQKFFTQVVTKFLFWREGGMVLGRKWKSPQAGLKPLKTDTFSKHFEKPSNFWKKCPQNFLSVSPAATYFIF